MQTFFFNNIHDNNNARRYFVRHRLRSSVNFRGVPNFCPKICIKKQENARILHDSCPKNARILCNNCPKTYFLLILGGWGTCPSAPVSYASVVRFNCLFVAEPGVQSAMRSLRPTAASAVPASDGQTPSAVGSSGPGSQRPHGGCGCRPGTGQRCGEARPASVASGDDLYQWFSTFWSVTPCRARAPQSPMSFDKKTK